MEKLFGIPMDSIMIVMLVVLAGVLATLGVVAIRNRVMFKLGLRNIPRRRAQTVLIVLGLMLSTLIISSAFGTGDTMTYSIRSQALQQIGHIDETIAIGASSSSPMFSGPSDARGAAYFPFGDYEALKTSLASYDKIDGMAPVIQEVAPLIDLTSEQNRGRVTIRGADPTDISRFGQLVERGGNRVALADLGASEAYLNWRVAKDINAHAGDKLQVYVQQRPVELTLKAVLEDGGVAGTDPTLLVSLSTAQEMFGKAGQINRIYVSNLGGTTGGAALSDEVTKKLRTLLADDDVANQLRTLLATTAVVTEIDAAKAKSLPAVANKLTALKTELAKDATTPDLKSLLGDNDIRAQLKLILPRLSDKQLAETIDNTLANLSKFTVDDVKKQGLDGAEMMGSVFSTIFVGFGLFSISAGVLLIFLIFVMLAAERKPEMGMARAVGMKRRHLIQTFIFEGMVYDLLASAVGAALGIAVGYGMVGIMASVLGQEGMQLQGHFEPRSVIVSYCLGVLLTFVTVAISAWRVSRLNIVAAIRDLTDIGREDAGMWALFLNPFRLWFASLRFLFRFRLRRAFGTYFVSVPIAMWAFWWALFRRGPMMVVLGVVLIWVGIATVQGFPFTLGVSLGLIGLGMSLRTLLRQTSMRTDLEDRIGYTFAGLTLLIYWSLPFDALDFLGLPEFSSGIEMFFLSGVMMVAGAVWTIIYNSDLLLKALVLTVGRFGRIIPVVKTAVAYPMSQKFRTGITLAMFALIMFTMIVMSVIISSMSGAFSDTAVMTGGYSIQGDVNFNNPIPDVRQAISASSKLKIDDFEAVAGTLSFPVELRQTGQTLYTWNGYFLEAVDDGYLDSNAFKLSLRAPGYATDRDVWKALKDNHGLAVIDSNAVPSRNNSTVSVGGPTFKLDGIYQEDKEMSPIKIQVRDARSGLTMDLTIIAVRDPRTITFGITTSKATLAKVIPNPLPATTYLFKTKPGVDVKQTSLNLGSAFVKNGMETTVLDDAIRRMVNTNVVLNNLLQGFMALGLLVGIAALGVISTRAVVERRQQIGVLRAIGYQRDMVQLSFLMESSFVALLGILIGVGLGLVLSYNMFTFIAKQQEGITLSIPWLQIGMIVVVAYAASLLTTYLPARQAAGVYPAEALRYE